MTSAIFPLCDGCGQPASPEHIARRLKRLEWTTRYRPLHIHTLFLGGVSPDTDAEFLYSPEGEFKGEAAAMLAVAGLSATGKSTHAVHAEFQRCGFLLTHMLECPPEHGFKSNASLSELLAKRAPAVAARIRRSLRPKRVAFVSQRMEDLAKQWTAADLGCALVLDGGKPYALDGSNAQQAIISLRESIYSPVTGSLRTGSSGCPSGQAGNDT
jgi:hypothetical protein